MVTIGLTNRVKYSISILKIIFRSTHHAGRVRKMNTQVSNDINSLLDFKINPKFQYQNDQPVVVDAWREDDLDSGETISKGRIMFETSRNGRTIQSRTKEFTGVSLKDVHNQMEEFLNKNYHHGMKTTEYDCKLNAKITDALSTTSSCIIV